MIIRQRKSSCIHAAYPNGCEAKEYVCEVTGEVFSRHQCGNDAAHAHSLAMHRDCPCAHEEKWVWATEEES